MKMLSVPGNDTLSTIPPPHTHTHTHTRFITFTLLLVYQICIENTTGIGSSFIEEH